MIGEFRGEHGFLSNFSKSPIEYEGEVYPTLEHAFQAAKTRDPEERARIRKTANPVVAKRIGRKVSLRGDWEEVKGEVMFALLRQKFGIPALREKLLATGEEELVEGNRWHDKYWGRCSCEKCGGAGQNELGKALMLVRKELSEKS